jgi:Tfp pilus assembly protein PilE
MKGSFAMKRFPAGFTIIELVTIIVVLCILMSIAIHQYGDYQESSCSSRNTQNVLELANATEAFNLAGNTLTNIAPDSQGNVDVSVIANQLIAAGYLYPNPKITSVEILTKYYADPGTDTNGAPAAAQPGVLFFLPTKDD